MIYSRLAAWTRWRGFSRPAFWMCLFGAMVGAFLVATHYVKAYSDPVGFLYLAEALWSGHPVTERALVYPAVLGLGLRLLGPAWVFLFNVPFVLLLIGLIYLVVRASLTDAASTPVRTEVISFIAFAVTAFFVLVERHLFLELQNPFREPLCFSLLLAGVLAAFRFRRAFGWRAALACGLCLGLAGSVRETCLLVALPVGLWALWNGVLGRRKEWALFIGLAAVGGGLGLVPFFLQNVMHSGQAVVPSYAADKLDKVVEEQSWDIPIPGMSIHHFRKTGAASVAKVSQNFTWLGLLLAILGVVRSVRRRDLNALLLLGPAFGLNFLFYCFYLYAKMRYLLVAELFLLPFVALGALLLFEGITGRVRAGLSSRWLAWGYALVVLVAVGGLGRTWLNAPPKLKVWQVDTLRDEILPKLEKPFTVVGDRHHGMMLAWLLDGIYEEPTRTMMVDYELTAQGENFTDEFFQRTCAHFAEVWADRNIYTYGLSSRVLLGNWYDFTSVMSFTDVTVPIEHYGKRLDDRLYHVTPWHLTHVKKVFDLPSSAGTRALLILDTKRIADMPSRTYTRLQVGSTDHSVAGGTEFIAVEGLPKGAGSVTCVLDSDAPLPSSPWMKLYGLNDPITLDLGAACTPSPYSFCSESLHRPYLFKADSRLLWDSGRVTLPVFASTNNDVYASFKVEFLQQDTHWRKEGFNMTLRSPAETITSKLPTFRRAALVTVKLGTGSGKLELIDLDLTTNLPGIDAQRNMVERRETDSFGAVKLYTVVIFSHANMRVSEFFQQVGAEDDYLCLRDGFHDAEGRRTGSPFRWTRGTSFADLPLKRTGEAYTLTVHCEVPGPVARQAAQPSFEVDGVPVPPSQVRLKDSATGGQRFLFTVVPQAGENNAPVNLRIETPTWVPADVGAGGDRRVLGIQLKSIRAEPADA